MENENKYDLKADLERSYGKDSPMYEGLVKGLEPGSEVAKMIEDNILNLRYALNVDNNILAKALAASVRYHMEDFHAKHLSDEQMRELNPIIRNAIFILLEDMTEERYFKISGMLRLNLPSYWEDCEYLED